MSLDVAMLIAGCKARGTVEARVSALLSDAAEAANIIFMCVPETPSRLPPPSSLPFYLLRPPLSPVT
jgi:hypothetical protein